MRKRYQKEVGLVRLMIIFAAVMALALPCTLLAAQQMTTVHVVVKDAKTGEPIYQAHLTLRYRQQGGFMRLEDRQEWQEQLSCCADGHDHSDGYCAESQYFRERVRNYQRKSADRSKAPEPAPHALVKRRRIDSVMCLRLVQRAERHLFGVF